MYVQYAYIVYVVYGERLDTYGIQIQREMEQLSRVAKSFFRRNRHGKVKITKAKGVNRTVLQIV